ncbi:CAP domain-containing protein [Streptomyces sp. NPDC016459]|uniref:CAP domain-containing protein n=1 Tax=Streptomyces sp. NPDC016459 TaxID=3157190 RepID=UPI0033F23286
MRHHDHPEDRAAHADSRHRGGGRWRRPRRRPSFRTAVTLAGAATAVLTVATGVHMAASTGADPRASGPTVGGPTASGTSTSGTTTSGTTTSGPGAAAPAVAAPIAPQGEQQGPVKAAEARAGKAASFVQDVVARVNAERGNAGCAPLRADRHLRTAAQRHADDMSARDYYSHDSPDGRDGGDRMSDAGYAWSAWAENIHRGPRTPAQAMGDWMDSSGHRANILNCSFKDIGVGVALTADGPYWVQNFGAKR